MLGSHFDGNNLYILWGFLKGNTMVCSTLSLREKSINWSDMIKIPEKYSNLFVYNSANECHFVSDKFYLGAGDTIICFDIKTYQISGLERITDKLDNLIPQTKRWTMGNQIVPAQIVGFNKDMIIASLEYVSIESPNKYDILFVIKKDRLSGIFCWDYIDNIFTVTTYNKKMHKQTTESFEDISDLNVLIKWQNMKYST